MDKKMVKNIPNERRMQIFSSQALNMRIISKEDSSSVKCHHLTDNPDLAWEEMKTSQLKEKVKTLELDTPIFPNSVRFVCVSDTHNYKVPIPPADVLLHAGDFSNNGDMNEIHNFNEFLGTLPHKYKVVIAGNHETSFDPLQGKEKYSGVPIAPSGDIINPRDSLTNCIYLEDSGVEIYGISIYGTPWQPEFGNWAFNLPRGSALLDKWNQIPAGVDVLLTHSPPIGHGDIVFHGSHTGCVELLLSIQKRIKPKYHVFGHIHEGYGVTTDGHTIYINCSVCDRHYHPVNPPIIFDIPLKIGQSKC